MPAQLPDTKFKILVIVGPTSSGKSELAVKLAKRFNGEIISCDSRQIYRGLNLGTGKIQGHWKNLKLKSLQKIQETVFHGRKKLFPVFYYKNIVHHCIDYINPNRQYSAALFARDAKKAIADVFRRGKLPILCGGTAHWIDAVVFNQNLPDVKPNKKLRASLEKKSSDELYRRLLKLDPNRARTIDQFNKRRLIRALEIVITTGKPVPALSVIPTDRVHPREWGDILTVNYQTNYNEQNLRNSSPDQSIGLGMTNKTVLWLGIKTNQKDLYKKIKSRLKQRLKLGMVDEIRRLHSPFLKGQRGQTFGLSWHRLEAFGLEYRYVSQYLRFLASSPSKGEARRGYNEMFTQLLYAIKHYSKRQMTWWKKNKEIKWIKNYSQANFFLSSRLTK